MAPWDETSLNGEPLPGKAEGDLRPGDRAQNRDPRRWRRSVMILKREFIWLFGLALV